MQNKATWNLYGWGADILCWFESSLGKVTSEKNNDSFHWTEEEFLNILTFLNIAMSNFS